MDITCLDSDMFPLRPPPRLHSTTPSSLVKMSRSDSCSNCTTSFASSAVTWAVEQRSTEIMIHPFFRGSSYWPYLIYIYPSIHLSIHPSIYQIINIIHPINQSIHPPTQIPPPPPYYLPIAIHSIHLYPYQPISTLTWSLSSNFALAWANLIILICVIWVRISHKQRQLLS